MNKTDLKIILKKHNAWVVYASGGVRADLSGANLSGANLDGTLLEKINWLSYIGIVPGSCNNLLYGTAKDNYNDHEKKLKGEI